MITTVRQREGRLLIRGKVVWIDGYFGVGRTTTADDLTARVRGSTTSIPMPG